MCTASGQALFGVVVNKQSNEVWLLVAVYADTNEIERRTLWQNTPLLCPRKAF